MQELSDFWLENQNKNPSKSFSESLVDKTAIVENDGRSMTRTYMSYSYDDSDDELNWDKLRKINDGMYASERSQQNDSAKARRDFKSFCNILGLSDLEIERGMYIFKNIDNLKDVGSVDNTLESVILGIATLVTDENCNKLENRLTNKDIFEVMCKSNDVSKTDIRRVRTRIREKYDFFD